MPDDETSLEDDVAATLDRLVASGLTVATAESCTGGLIAAALTARAGSSAAVLGGFVAYANGAKTAMLGVPHALIDRHGAVSREVARAMADGARARTGADIAVSVTGIAGPGGGTPGKPVGTVWFGVAGREPIEERVVFEGDRDQVRARTVRHALRLVRRDAGDRG